VKNSKVLKVILVIAGVVGMVVGGANLFVPVAFNASSGIDLGDNINLINEMRASGGGLLLSGFVILLGAFVSRLSFTSTLLATILYLGYGFSRVFSIMIDGMPSDELIQVLVFEIFVGLLALYAFLKYRVNG